MAARVEQKKRQTRSTAISITDRPVSSFFAVTSVINHSLCGAPRKLEELESWFPGQPGRGGGDASKKLLVDAEQHDGPRCDHHCAGNARNRLQSAVESANDAGG